MKALFEANFPFVKQPDSELTEDQIAIKRQYEKKYIKVLKNVEEIETKEPVESKKHKLRKFH